VAGQTRAAAHAGHEASRTCPAPRAEHRIFTNLRTTAQDRAVILVTHYLANASVADRIVTMAVEQPGIFQQLWQLRNDRNIPVPRYGQ